MQPLQGRIIIQEKNPALQEHQEESCFPDRESPLISLHMLCFWGTLSTCTVDIYYDYVLTALYLFLLYGGHAPDVLL